MSSAAFVKSVDRLVGRSALEAFRSDLPLGGAEPTKQDGVAIMVATLVRQSLAAGIDDSSGIRIRSEAVEMAKRSLGEAKLTEGCTYDDHSAEADTDVFRLLAQRTEHAGWLNLAQHLLESTAEFCRDAIGRGRILSDRSRISRKRGLLDLSQAQNEELLRLGIRLKSADLAARAHIGLSGLAQTRGNFFEFQKYQLKTLRIARRAGLRRSRASAHEGLGTYASIRGDYNAAVNHLWSAYRLADGAMVIENAALVNLAQTFLVSGHFENARKVVVLVLNGAPPLQSALPVLGSYAIASSHLGDVAAVEWATSQVRRLAKSRHHPRDVAGALFECASALEHVGHLAQGGVLRRRAERMALSYGFHDLTFAESIASGALPFTERQRFTGLAARANAEIEEMDMPEHAADVQPVLV